MKLTLRSVLLVFLASSLASGLACAHRPAPLPPPVPGRAEPERRAPPAVHTDPTSPLGPEQAPPPEDPLRVVRSEVDALLRAQALALWTAWTRGERADLARTYTGRERLFTAETVRSVHEAMLRASGDERRALGLLHGFLAGEHLARETAATADRLARARASATVTWNGQAVAADRVPALLTAEPDAARRAALQRAALATVPTWASLADALAQDLDSAARRLGHPSLLALAAEIRGETTEALAALAEDVLDGTAPAYEAAMGALAQSELGARLEAVRGADVPRLLRSAHDAKLFPPARLIPDVRSLFAGLGLDPTARGCFLDAEARPRKDPRALALPVDVPGDVRLSVVPGGGVPELRALLQEMGAAAYYVRVESPRVEFRRLGSAVPHGWSLLFAEVAGDPAWLLARTGDTEHHLAPIVRAATARRIHGARAAAVQLLLEVRRPRSSAEAAALLERAYARPVPAEEAALALAERDPLLQSADTLRAILLAAEAEVSLGARGSTAWWAQPSNGAWLARAFAAGARPTPLDLARSLGAPGLRAAPLAELGRARARWAEQH